MSRAGVDDLLDHDSLSSVSALSGAVLTQLRDGHLKRLDHAPPISPARPRRTPRKSLIVVLGENERVAGESLTNHMLSSSGHEQLDVIVACAGQPADLGALQRRVGDLQVLLAPEGTSTEDLRELAMGCASGDIVVLVSGRHAELAEA